MCVCMCVCVCVCVFQQLLSQSYTVCVEAVCSGLLCWALAVGRLLSSPHRTPPCPSPRYPCPEGSRSHDHHSPASSTSYIKHCTNTHSKTSTSYYHYSGLLSMLNSVYSICTLYLSAMGSLKGPVSSRVRGGMSSR